MMVHRVELTQQRPAASTLRDRAVSKRYVLCVMAANRTGILAAVTTALSELGGDIHEASQTVVDNFFTITLAADFPEHRDAQVIVGHLEGVCRPFGVAVVLKDPLREGAKDNPPERSERYVLTLTGRDAPGIVAKISGRLARDGIGITDLRGSRNDGGQSFALILELAVPPGINTALLQTELEQSGLSAQIERDGS